MQAIQQHQAEWSKLVIGGIVGGIAGGIVFGMLMAMMGMPPMIASMAGSDSPTFLVFVGGVQTRNARLSALTQEPHGKSHSSRIG